MAASSSYTALLLLLISANALLLPHGAKGDTADVLFVVATQVAYGQGFVIAGNCSSLGSWTPTSAPLMSLATGTESYWLLTVALEEGLYLEFKPVRVVYDTKVALEWYNGNNLDITVPASGSCPTSVYIEWNGSTSLSDGASTSTATA
ncbi:hypothetical protein L7F22_050321 [Adiantum nelumboides]|nr:hypothetical protein [Adiantum nelumboides]